MAEEELSSFCFNSLTELDAARNSLNFLLLPNEKTFIRPEQRCMDVVTSPDRVKLLEKYLRVQYTLVGPEAPEKKVIPAEVQNCQMEFKKTSENKAGLGNLNAGTYNSGIVSSMNKTTVETSELLLGMGKPGAINIDKQVIYVECRKGSRGDYNLTFALSESDEATRISSVVNVKKNEFVDVGQITKELNEKQKMIGVPQAAVSTAVGTEETTYQLQVKN